MPVSEANYHANLHRNPYQAKVNYFQTALKSSKPDLGSAHNKNSRKIKYSKRTKYEKAIRDNMKAKIKRVSRAMTPSSHNMSSAGSQRGLAISHSAKDQISIRDEMYKSNSKEELQDQIMKLNRKIMRLEEGNKWLVEENKRYKSIYSQEPNPGSLKPPQYQYKLSSKRGHRKDSSRKKFQNSKNFSQTDKFSDFRNSYSFENKDWSNVINTPNPEIENQMNANNYMTIPSFCHDKENLKTNVDINHFIRKSTQKESVLMQKVNKILERRSKKHKSKSKSKRKPSELPANKTYKSLKHSKNEIIARINNKYGKRLF